MRPGQLLWDVVLHVALLASVRSIAVDVRSVFLDGFVSASSELVIGHFPATCIQSAHLCLYPISWHQLVAGGESTYRYNDVLEHRLISPLISRKSIDDD